MDSIENATFENEERSGINNHSFLISDIIGKTHPISQNEGQNQFSNNIFNAINPSNTFTNAFMNIQKYESDQSDIQTNSTDETNEIFKKSNSNPGSALNSNLTSFCKWTFFIN